MDTTEHSEIKPTDVVQNQLIAYNDHDLDGFAKNYTDNVILAHVGGEVILRGVAALREHYRSLFTDFPQSHADLRYRAEVGNRVIDHEVITRNPETIIEAVAIYTVQDGLIARVDFVA